MYIAMNVLRYNIIIKEHIQPNVRYTLDTIRVPTYVQHQINIKNVKLFYFPSAPQCAIIMISTLLYHHIKITLR